MNLKTKRIWIIILLFLAFFSASYDYLDLKIQGYLIQQKTEHIGRIIDGDTIVADSGKHIRLLGINAPEITTKEKYSQEAKEFLEDLILNKTVLLEFGKEEKDRYNRTLAYIYFEDKNINLEMVKNGFANFYFPSGKDMYYKKFLNAWENCNKNLCEISKDKCVSCIKLIHFDYKNEIVVFENICEFKCELTNWEIKDEGRKKFIFPEFNLEPHKKVLLLVGEGKDNQTNLFWKNQDYVWTDSGDTLFLRDGEKKLVLWKSY